MASNKHFISVAIDFGTTYSGYAFSFTSDPKRVQTFVWEWDGFQSGKTPTNILFDENKKFVSFGFQAEKDFIQKEKEGKAASVYFFKLFKLKLFKNKNLSRMTEIYDYSRIKKMLAVDVFSAGIKFLKEHFLSKLHEKGQLIFDNDIQWVLTVPAIWDDAAKQFMRESAHKAGISGENLLLALEPEAASVYCLMNKEEIDGLQNNIRVGQRYMIIDCGGGTVDITVHEVRGDVTVKEIFKASGGDWGGMHVDEEFQLLLLEIFDFDCVEGMSLEDKLQVVSKFQKTKQLHSSDIPSKVSFWIPHVLQRNFDVCNLEGTNYSGKISVVGNNLRIRKDLYEHFFDSTKNKIVEHVREIFRQRGLMNNDVPLIIMVGGFSNSCFIQSAIRCNFPFKKVVVPGDSSMAVLKGAVLMGHNRSLISSRIMPYTYGVETCSDFIDGYHDPQYKFTVGSRIKCNDLFDKYVTIGDNVSFGHKSRRKSYKPTYEFQEAMAFPLYRSTDDNPKYTDEPSCSRIGTLSIPLSRLPKDEQSVKAYMEFGQIELKLTVEDTVTGEIRQGKFDFLG